MSQPYPMALACRTDDHDLTASVIDTLTEIDLSSTKCPTRHNEKRTSRTTNESLPVEVWMQIFEHVHIEDYARQAVVAVYRSSVAVYGDSIKAAEPLPPFEKRTWKRIRGLYHIDRNSRAAALKLNMCLRGLQECRGPSLAAKRLARVAQLMRRGLFPNLLPNYVAISVSWLGYCQTCCAAGTLQLGYLQYVGSSPGGRMCYL